MKFVSQVEQTELSNFDRHPVQEKNNGHFKTRSQNSSPEKEGSKLIMGWR